MEADKGKAPADKGKAPTDERKVPTFMADYGSDTPSREATVTLGLRIKATNQALRDHHFVEELVMMVMLSID